MEIKIKKLVESAVVPSYSLEGDAGLDLTAISADCFPGRHYVEYGTGLSIEIPKGYAGFLLSRSSSINTCLRLSNTIGLIDSGFRGELTVRFTIENYKKPMYKVGDRIAQLVIIPYVTANIVVSEALSPSTRGSGGWGSTGR